MKTKFQEFPNSHFVWKGYRILLFTSVLFMMFHESSDSVITMDKLHSTNFINIQEVRSPKAFVYPPGKEKKFFKNLLYDLRKKYRHLKKRERDEIVASTIITVLLVLFGLALLLLFLEWLGAVAVGYVFFFGGALAIIIWAIWNIDRKRKASKAKNEIKTP